MESFKILKEDFSENPTKAINIFSSLGVLVIESYFKTQELDGISQELKKFYQKIPEGKFVSFGEKGSGIKIRNEYASGKGISIGPSFYKSFPKTINLILSDRKLSNFIKNFYPLPNKELLQVFSSLDYLPTSEENMSVNSYLHIDANAAIKFGVMLQDTKEGNGCLFMIPKSHVEGEYIRKNYMTHKIVSKPGFNYTLEDFKNELQLKFIESDSINIETKKGDLIVFNTECWHGGGFIKEDGNERIAIYYHNRK
jgi:hypothetical protein